ncbi:MAG: ABC transporter permease subunit [Christensenellaceae bacterium]|nr:ABC transporter permease subunit [Christensenellaceae bacterium]
MRSLWRQRQLVVLSLSIVLIILFSYVPLWGWLIAFQNYKPSTKISFFQQQWVGMKNFVDLFNDPRFTRALRNTLAIGALKIVFSYLFTLLLAVLLNEIRVTWFKRTVQTISYLPHFVSWVVAANLFFVTFSPEGGIVNVLFVGLGLAKSPISFMGEPSLFWVMVALSEVWKNSGYGAIVYLAAMTAIDPALYESADIDGASRVRKILAITLPSIAPTIKILLVLSIGRLLSVGFEQVYLLKTPSTTQVGTTLEIFIYEFAMKFSMYSMGSSMSIFNSLISIILIVGCNFFAKFLDGEGIM